MTDAPPLLAVVSGPSGVGKDALLALLLEGGDFVRPLTMTSRPPRPGEADGVHYRFASPGRFEAALAAGELVEHAEVHGHRYGTPRSELRAALASGRDVLLQVDVRGALAIREAAPDALLVFVAPESLGQLERRLRARPGADEAEVARRLVTARGEMAQRDAFDAVVVNAEGALHATADRVRGIVVAARARPGRRPAAV